MRSKRLKPTDLEFERKSRVLTIDVENVEHVSTKHIASCFKAQQIDDLLGQRREKR